VTDRVRLEAVVRGRVQGVGFRYFVLHRATALALDGWVANDADGSVRCRAEGARAALDYLVDALRSGPPGAIVTEVSTTWSEAQGDLGPFRVRSGAHPGD
jgi:acylphosphatase